MKTEIKKEAAAEKAAGKTTFLGSIVTAVEEHPDDAAVLLDGALPLPAPPKARYRR